MDERSVQEQREKCAQVARACAVFHTRRTARAVTQLYDQMLAPSGLRSTQLTLLAALALAGPLSMTRLSAGLLLDRTTLTRNLRPLEEAGLIRSALGPDRRERRIEITAAGRERLAAALPLWDQAQARIVDKLGRSRWQSLLGGLDEMVKIAQQP